MSTKNLNRKTEPYIRDLEFRGFVEGVTILDNSSSKPQCHFFGGIPYALPPVGPFRWRKPRSLPPCFRYGTRANPGRYTGGASFCPQPDPNGDVPPEVWDEDCLQCNIWMPVGEPPKGGWPVVFWIREYFSGSNSEYQLTGPRWRFPPIRKSELGGSNRDAQ